MTDNADFREQMTIQEQAQWALSTLLSSHPDSGVEEFGRLLERIGPDHPDAPMIEQVIERLEELGDAIADIEHVLDSARSVEFDLRRAGDRSNRIRARS